MATRTHRTLLILTPHGQDADLAQSTGIVQASVRRRDLPLSEGFTYAYAGHGFLHNVIAAAIGGRPARVIGWNIPGIDTRTRALADMLVSGDIIDLAKALAYEPLANRADGGAASYLIAANPGASPVVLDSAHPDEPVVATITLHTQPVVEEKRRNAHLVAQAAAEFGVDRNLAMAVAHQESGFLNDGPPSRTGARGIMQLMPDLRADFAHFDPLTPAGNARAGVANLRKCLDRFRHLEDALAAYRSGRSRIAKQGVSRGDLAYAARVITKRNYYDQHGPPF